MADGIYFDWDASAFDAMVTDIKPATRRATMYAMRATGRRLAAVAKARAPVYHGDDPRATAESGNLRKSIRNARRLDALGDVYTLKVGPFGSKKKGTAISRATGELRGVPLYRAQQEARHGFMVGAIGMADAEAKTVFEGAYAKAWAKWAV